MHDHDNEHDELAWQAFRYVAGEQDAAEQEHFAALLAEDQAAREAVARAYELTQATALALAAQPAAALRPTRSAAGRARWAWAAVAAAACIVVALSWLPSNDQQSPAASVKTAALAAHWSEVRQQQASEPEWQDELPSDSLPAEDWTDELNDVGSDAQPAIAPDWMLAAVAEERGSDDMREALPGDIESRSEESQEQ